MLLLSAFDISVLKAIHVHCSNPFLDFVMMALTTAGTYAWALIIAVPFLLRKGEDFKWFCLMLIPLLLMSDQISNFLKLLVMRPRPFMVLPDINLFTPVGHLSVYSFPSNHAANSFAFAGLAGFFFGHKKMLPVYVGAAIVAISRVYIGVHYPSDVLAGAILGFILSLGVAKMDRKAITAATPSSRRNIWAGMTAIGLILHIIWKAISQN